MQFLSNSLYSGTEMAQWAWLGRPPSFTMAQMIILRMSTVSDVEYGLSTLYVVRPVRRKTERSDERLTGRRG